MGFTLSSILKDLRRLDRSAVLIWLGIPFLIGGLMTMLVGGDDVRPRGVLLIADEDDSLLSGALGAVFGQGELGELIVVEPVRAGAGRERIDADEASAFLTIPAGFGAALIDGEPVTLTLVTNPSQTILPGIIREVLEILLDGGFYARALFASELEMIRSYEQGDIPDDAAVAAIAVAVQDKLEAVAPHLFPPTIDLTVVEPPAAEPTPSFALLFLPGIVLMGVMFATSGFASDYWEERERGTLRRLVSAPGRMTGFLAGKALAAGTVTAVVGAVTLVAGFIYHDVGLGRLPVAIAWTTLSGIALFAWFGVLYMLASTRRTANIVSLMVMFPLLMAGGSFFPFAALPEWIAEIGRRTPNGFVADRLTLIVTGAPGQGIDAASWLGVLLFAAGGLGVCAWRLHGGFARG